MLHNVLLSAGSGILLLCMVEEVRDLVVRRRRPELTWRFAAHPRDRTRRPVWLDLQQDRLDSPSRAALHHQLLLQV